MWEGVFCSLSPAFCAKFSCCMASPTRLRVTWDVQQMRGNEVKAKIRSALGSQYREVEMRECS